MPKAPDKIIINDIITGGMQAAVNAHYDALKHLGDEIIKKGWEDETIPHRDKLRVECDRHYQSEAQHIEFLRGLCRELEDFIDGHK